jgi:hypothetical protein
VRIYTIFMYVNIYSFERIEKGENYDGREGPRFE